MHTDPIADMATRIRNAYMARHEGTSFPYSKMKESILAVLKSKTYIFDYKKEDVDGKPQLRVFFSNKRPTLSIKRISKPGRRVYTKASDIKPVKRGYGISVISTSAGVMAGFEAYTKKIGGEVLLEVY